MCQRINRLYTRHKSSRGKRFFNFFAFCSTENFLFSSIIQFFLLSFVFFSRLLYLVASSTRMVLIASPSAEGIQVTERVCSSFGWRRSRSSKWFAVFILFFLTFQIGLSLPKCQTNNKRSKNFLKTMIKHVNCFHAHFSHTSSERKCFGERIWRDSRALNVLANIQCELSCAPTIDLSNVLQLFSFVFSLGFARRRRLVLNHGKYTKKDSLIHRRNFSLLLHRRL